MSPNAENRASCPQCLDNYTLREIKSLRARAQSAARLAVPAMSTVGCVSCLAMGYAAFLPFLAHCVHGNPKSRRWDPEALWFLTPSLIQRVERQAVHRDEGACGGAAHRPVVRDGGR